MSSSIRNIFQFQAWSVPASVRLDWWITIGGPLRQKLQNVRFVIEPRAFRNDFEREAASVCLRESATLSVVLPKSFDARAFFEFFSLESRPIELIDIPTSALPHEPLEDWLRAYVPEFRADVSRALARLRKELPEECELRPWSALGYLPGLLRREAPVEAQVLSYHWARAQAWLSPQNENAVGPDVRLNPTLQIVRDESHGQRRVWLIARVGQRVRERELTIHEAALVDELGESRSSREELRSFSASLESLERDGFILTESQGK